MQEEQTIGKVNLNFKHYSGLDLYSDGAIENELLEIVQKYNKEQYQEVIEQRANWPVLYHLSEQRGNIVEWIPMEGNEKVLEVGLVVVPSQQLLHPRLEALPVLICPREEVRSMLGKIRIATM
jgi:hypothetical protein